MLHPGLKSKANAKVPKTCILPNDQQEATLVVVKNVSGWINSVENPPSDHFLCDLTKHCPDDASFKSYSIQHDVRVVSYVPVSVWKDDNDFCSYFGTAK